MKRNKPPPARRRSLENVGLVTIVGLGAVGRQTALLLAAMGLPRLQLVDSRVVTRALHAAEGYPFEDVGRPRVHAAAQQCHQLNPRLDISALFTRTLRGIDPGDAVLGCPGRPRSWVALLQRSQRTLVAARCDVVGSTVRLDLARDAASLAERLARASSSSLARRSSRKAIPIPVATIAAGWLVAEFTRFLVGDAPERSVRLDVDAIRWDVNPRRWRP